MTSVCVRPSNIPHGGQGLFAARAFRRGEEICPYAGVLIDLTTTTPSELQQRYGLQITQRYLIDGSDPTSGPGRYANDCRGQDKNGVERRGNNASFKVNKIKKTACLIARRNIREGEEIFVGYGPAYWKRWSAVSTC